MRQLYCTIVIFFYLVSAKAQFWEPVGGGTDQFVTDLYADTVDNILYAVGRFQFAGDSVVYQIAGWKDGAWHKVGNGTNDIGCIHGCNAIFSIEKYNSELFIAGHHTIWPDTIKYLSRWNGVAWVECGELVNPAVEVNVINGELFCMGWFETIDGQPIKQIAKWTGSDWVSFGGPVPFVMDGAISCGDYYNGNYYFGGNFSYLSPYQDIVRWDGTQWLNLENGIKGGIAFVTDIMPFQNYLFVGGYFKESDGNIADYLMAWNGQYWFDPFPNVQFVSQVEDLVIIENDLYIVDAHYIVGDSQLYGLARFDGTSFCSMGGSDNLFYEIDELNDTLYAATQWVCDGDTLTWISSMPMNTPADTCIYQPLSLNQQDEIVSFIMYPNPSTNFITISVNVPGDQQNYIIYSLLGEKIMSGIINEHNTLVDITGIDPGVYILELHMDGKKACKRLLKL